MTVRWIFWFLDGLSTLALLAFGSSSLRAVTWAARLVGLCIVSISIIICETSGRVTVLFGKWMLGLISIVLRATAVACIEAYMWTFSLISNDLRKIYKDLTSTIRRAVDQISTL